MLNRKAMMAAPAAVPQYIEDVFSTWLYTGNGSTQTINNGIDLAGKGGLVWIKPRSGYILATSYGHLLFDTSRGVKKAVFSNRTDAQVTSSNEGITNFNSNGFDVAYGVGTDLGYDSNSNTFPIASWTFRKAPKFFDVVTYTGNGANRTIAHNLGSVPGMIIVKRTDTTGDWQVYHRSLANTEYLVLNTTAAKATGATRWNSTTPTASVFSLGTDATVNASGGTYVAYLFAHDAGGFGEAGDQSVVSCGSYTGGGSASPVTVNIGYEPQFIFLKRTNGTSDWYMFDTVRGMSWTSGAYLSPNLAGSEQAIGGDIRPTATGWIDNGFWGNGEQVIYLAIRRGPMKTPTSGTEVFTPVARTGTGANATVASGFVTDTVIEGNRASSTAGTKFGTWDRLRGINYLLTTTTDAEAAAATTIIQANPWDVMNGYKVGTTSTLTNASSNTFINWMFRRAPGFFDVVCYTGTGSGDLTVKHNLAVAPELIITKGRNNATNGIWPVYCAKTGLSSYGFLNSNQVFISSVPPYISVSASSYVVRYFSTAAAVSLNHAIPYVSYLFATLPGVSKVGSYTGTGTTQQINCGFTTGARLVLIKRTDSTGSWYIWDSARGIVAGNDPYLLLNSTAAEVTNTDYVDALASGFEITSTAPAEINASGGSYIYLAIA